MKLRNRVDNGDKAHAGTKARKDLIFVAVVVVIGCIVAVSDPDKVFEWIAQKKAVQVDEGLVAIVIVGTGFAVFSWRRWTDLSRQVAEYKRLQTELSQFNREATLLSETVDLLQSSLSSEEACRVIIQHIESQLPASNGAICVIADSRDLVDVVAKWGEPTFAEGVFAPKDCWALRRGRVYVQSASDSRIPCPHIGPNPASYSMCLPMMAQGETLGVLYLDSGKMEMGRDGSSFQPLSDSEQRMVKTLAENLALAVANLNLRETLRAQSIRDPLTGLFNRRYMEESLERELHRSIRKKAPLTVMMVDVDHFKRFNDTFGHEAGDAVLREVARVFRSQLRADDIACRYGGEEFTLILPEAPLEVVRERAEQLRQAVKNTQVQERGRVLDQVTISVGIASYPQHGTTADALLGVADVALYKAKEEGRDRVVVA